MIIDRTSIPWTIRLLNSFYSFSACSSIITLTPYKIPQLNLPGDWESRRIYNLPVSFFVYILRTSSNTLYIGQTNNLEKRIKEHKNKSSKSAKYIRYFKTFSLVYSEKYDSRKSAMKREAQLKKWSKAKKEVLIKGNMTKVPPHI